MVWCAWSDALRNILEFLYGDGPLLWSMEDPLACNRASADFMISSPLMSEHYEQQLPDYDAYRERFEKEIRGGRNKMTLR